jgi:hypothetical protein|tara:strand:- start:9105 stop:9305 length:201 start_codon:yes stop_codon:yes gene_type:complete
MARTVFDVLSDSIKEAAVARTIFLSEGGAKNYPAYTEAVGYIQGMNEALRLVQELAQSYVDGDDDA